MDSSIEFKMPEKGDKFPASDIKAYNFLIAAGQSALNLSPKFAIFQTSSPGRTGSHVQVACILSADKHVFKRCDWFRTLASHDDDFDHVIDACEKHSCCVGMTASEEKECRKLVARWTTKRAASSNSAEASYSDEERNRVSLRESADGECINHILPLDARFEPGSTFPDAETARKAIQEYLKPHGFTTWSAGTKGLDLTYRMICSDRRRCCPFEFKLKRSERSEPFKVFKAELIHNHPPDAKRSRSAAPGPEVKAKRCIEDFSDVEDYFEAESPSPSKRACYGTSSPPPTRVRHNSDGSSPLKVEPDTATASSGTRSAGDGTLPSSPASCSTATSILPSSTAADSPRSWSSDEEDEECPPWQPSEERLAERERKLALVVLEEQENEELKAAWQRQEEAKEKRRSEDQQAKEQWEREEEEIDRAAAERRRVRDELIGKLTSANKGKGKVRAM